MSTLNVNRIADASGGVFAPVSSVHKNRIINGAMVIDQRNAGASVTATGFNNIYTLDRWNAIYATGGFYSVQQNAGSVTPPVGFTNYLGVTSLGANTGVVNTIQQPIEGFNTADLGWGTANARTITLSFWVRSSLTGTFGGAVSNSGRTRSYPFTYTISAANTWELETITIAGDTSGTWVGATNGIGLNLDFGLGNNATYSGTAGSWSTNNFYSATGAVSVVGTNGATFYITGVQLEVGTQATSFEYRQIQQELALAQRYYQQWGGVTASDTVGVGFNNAPTSLIALVNFPVQMRTAPALTFSAVSDFQVAGITCTALGLYSSTPTNARAYFDVASGLTTGQGAMGSAANTNARYRLSAEL